MPRSFRKRSGLAEIRYSEFCDTVTNGAVLCSPDQVLDLCDRLHQLIRLQRGWRSRPAAQNTQRSPAPVFN